MVIIGLWLVQWPNEKEKKDKQRSVKHYTEN
jgi:hypothetical protein